MLVPASALQGSHFSTTAIVLGCVAAFANVLGGLVVTARGWGSGAIRYFVALGAGFMLATCLLEIIPDSFAVNPSLAALLVLGGFLLVHLVEHTFVAHFHFGEETHESEFERPHVRHSVLAGLAIHTFFDGIAIGSGFVLSAWLGWVIFVAVVMHKVPEGLTVASVMIAAGQSKRAALFSSALIGAASVAGVIVMQLAPVSVKIALPISGGVTLYVASTDLLPEVNREPGVAMAFWVFVGAGLLVAARLIFRGAAI